MASQPNGDEQLSEQVELLETKDRELRNAGLSLETSRSMLAQAKQKLSGADDTLKAARSAIGLSISPFLITFSSIGILSFMSSPYLYIGTILSIASLVGAVITFVKKQKEEINRMGELETDVENWGLAEKDYQKEQVLIESEITKIRPQIDAKLTKVEDLAKKAGSDAITRANAYTDIQKLQEQGGKTINWKNVNAKRVEIMKKEFDDDIEKDPESKKFLDTHGQEISAEFTKIAEGQIPSTKESWETFVGQKLVGIRKGLGIQNQ